MPGTKAIAAMGSGVVAYALNERAASAVQPLSAPVQAELLDASVERGEGGVTMEFVAQVGEGGVPASSARGIGRRALAHPGALCVGVLRRRGSDRA